MSNLVFSPPSMVKKYLVSFSDCFNKIELPTANGGTLICPIRLGTTETLFTMAQVLDENRNRIRYSLPLLGFSLNSLEFDSNRPLSMLNTINSADKTSQIRNPIPYNLNIDLYLLCNRASELFQILEIILPMYQSSRSYPLVEYKFKDGSAITRDVPIELTSSSIDINGDVAGGDDSKAFSATLSFKLQGYLHQSYINNDIAYIKNIDITYEEMIADTYTYLTSAPVYDKIQNPKQDIGPIPNPVSTIFAEQHITDDNSGGIITNTLTEINS